MTPYLKLLDLFIKDLLGDLKSLRVQLIILAYWFNFRILWLIEHNKADYKLAVAGIGLLTAVYYFYFRSKELESQNKNNVLIN